MVRAVESASGAVRMSAAAEFIESFAPSDDLLIAGASRGAVDDFVRRIASDRKATFGWRRTTPLLCAVEIAAANLARECVAPATRLGLQALTIRAIFEARRAGPLRYFDPVVKSPGFPVALTDTLQELRLADIKPAALLEIGGPSAEVATLLTQFIAQCNAAAVADRAAIFTYAVRALESDPPAPASLPLLLLDVAVHTRMEQRFFRALLARAPRALATIAAGDEQTLDFFRSLCDIESLDPLRESQTSLARLQRHLFVSASPNAAGEDATVRFFSAPGEGRECVEIARQALEYAARGVPFERIAIFLRSPEIYTPLLETALARAGIPAYFSHGTERPDSTGRAFLALLTCRLEDFSARRFAEYLSHGQVPDADVTTADTVALPSDDTIRPLLAAVEEKQSDPQRPEAGLRSPWKWERLLTEAGVIGGKERWMHRLAAVETELELKLAALASKKPDDAAVRTLRREIENVRQFRAFAIPLIERLAALPELATWGEWLRALSKLALRAVRRPERVLAVLAELEPMSAVGPVGLDEVRDTLSERLTFLPIEPPRTRYGQIFIGTPDDARGRSFDVVFVPGLAERLFPQKPREDPLLLDDLRRRLGGGLALQPDRARAERLLLKLAIGAATERLILSYPRLEVVQGRPRVPSFYALDVMRAIRGHMPDVETLERDAERAVDARLAWPAPPRPEDAIDPIEHDLAVLGPLLQSNDPAAVSGRARYLLKLNAHLERSLRARWTRWKERSPWTPVDGPVRVTADTAPIFADRRLTAWPYSATALQRFAACPYQFFLASLCGLEPRAEAVAIERLDPLTRGKLFHEVQARVLRRLHGERALPVHAANLGSALEALDEIIDEVARDYRERLRPAILRVWQDEIDGIRADLRVWLRQMADEGELWEPVAFELGFGLSFDSGHDPASQAEPVTLPGGFQLRGAIDLVERRRGGGPLRVTDHKTGANKTRASMVVGGGELLQPVLYALAAEAILQSRVSEARLWYCTVTGGFTRHTVALDENNRRSGIEVLKIIDRAIAQGFLPPAPRADACKLCDFREVCGPYEATRCGRKDPTRLQDLDALRALR